ncbi:MAG: hypothetical protein HYU99_02595 [Deltaproteobacteria bacterium]|nr:hypothetical protein [Deltaproteobacteria bacterium]
MSEVDPFARLLNYVDKSLGPFDGSLKVKLKECMRLNGTVTSFSVDESKALLEKFKQGLKGANEKGEKYFSRTFLYFIEDIAFGLKNHGGYRVQADYSVTSEDGICNYNNHPEVLNLMRPYFGSIGDAGFIGGDVIEYAVNNRSESAEFVVVIVDAHLKEQQEPIQRLIIESLYPAGFRTIFSESDVYVENKELAVRNAPRGQIPGMRGEQTLRAWPIPRSAQALEFYYGDAIKTYGAESKELYAGFAEVDKSNSLERYMPALHERSYAMVDNMQKQMLLDGTQQSILIAGGAHVDSLMAEMDANGMNYIVIYPHGGVPLQVLEDQRELYKM